MDAGLPDPGSFFPLSFLARHSDAAGDVGRGDRESAAAGVTAHGGLGLVCRDIRTREAGIQDIHGKVRPGRVELVRRDYVANGGWETFLAYEDPEKDILIGLLRLRRAGYIIA